MHNFYFFLLPSIYGLLMFFLFSLFADLRIPQAWNKRIANYAESSEQLSTSRGKWELYEQILQLKIMVHGWRERARRGVGGKLSALQWIINTWNFAHFVKNNLKLTKSNFLLPFFAYTRANERNSRSLIFFHDLQLGFAARLDQIVEEEKSSFFRRFNKHNRKRNAKRVYTHTRLTPAWHRERLINIEVLFVTIRLNLCIFKSAA